MPVIHIIDVRTARCQWARHVWHDDAQVQVAWCADAIHLLQWMHLAYVQLWTDRRMNWSIVYGCFIAVPALAAVALSSQLTNEVCG